MCDESDQRLILNREKRHNSMLRSVRRILRLSVGKGDPRELIDQVCSCLTETPGYFNAWIVLVDEDSVARQVATAGDGPPTAFQELATSIKAGDIPPCARQAIQSDMAVSVILDPRKECGSCLMAPHYAGRAGLSAALRYDDRNLGVLTVSVLPELAVDSEELALLEDLADDIAFALHSIELAVKTQKSLDESRALYDVLVDSAPVGILVHQDEKLVFVNNEGARIFGASEPSEIVGRSIWDFVPEDLRHKTKDRIRRRAGTNTPDVFDIRQRRLTGEEIDVRVTARQVSYDGRPGTHVIFQNISDSKRVEQALRDSEQRFSRAFRSSPVAMTISKIHNGRLLDANDKWLSQWGFSLEEVVGRTPDEFGYWAEMDERSELVSRLRRDGEVRDFEASFIDGNNNKRVASVSGEFAEISGKKRLLLAFSDITDRLQAEAALRESEARFKSFMDAAPFGLAAKDTQGRFTYANHVVCGHFDVPQEAIIGKTAADFRRPDIAAAIAAAERVVVETGISQSYEGIMDDLKDGVQALRNIRFPLRNSDGEIAGIGVVTEDISDRNRAETALRESEERFSTAFQWNPVALCISRMDDGCHIDVNDRWLLELGHTRDEAIGRSAVELGVWADPPQRTVFVDRLKRDGIAYDFDALFRTKDGVEKSVLVNGKIIEVNAEQRLLIAFRDVTEHNQMARQLLQAQKMEAVGQLTGGVAHDFNNLLQVVETSLELAREMIPEGSKANELVNGALRAGHRGARLTQQLLAFSRKQTLSPENLDVRNFVERMTKLLSRTLGEDISIRTAFSDGLVNIGVDENGLTNTLLNLAINARSAMPKGGNLTIAATHRHFDAAAGPQNDPVAPGDYVEIAVSDDGSGMSEETLKSAFEPFFTTKEVGEGSGLGLSMAYGFAQQSGGNVTIASELGKGTTVRLLLPAANGETVPAANARTAKKGAQHTIKVLVVEDDDDVRVTTVMVLKSLGCEVIEADSAAPVPLILSQHDDIDLLLSDVVLPGGKNGIELAQEAADLYPDLKVILVSGYPEGTLEKAGLTETGFRLLGKPFSKAALSDALDSVMAE